MAQTISSKFQSQLHNLLRWNRGYTWNTVDNVYAYDETTLIEFKISTNLQNDASIFGNTICKYAEVKVQNPNNNTYAPSINETINLYTGLTLDINLPTQDVEYLNQGTFTILNFKEDRDNESFLLECYDSMIKFNVPYVETGTYPMSLGNFAAHLCAKIGLELGSSTFPNSTIQIQRPNVADNEYNVRSLLGWVAELAGGNAIIGRDDKVYVRNYGAVSTFTITPDIYFKLKKSPQFGPLNSVAMIREALGDSLTHPDPLPLTPISFKLIDNMVAYDQRESVIQTIYNTINGLTYVPFSLEWRATGHLDFMDKITITNTEGESIVSYVMNQTLTFNGSISEELSAVAYTAAAAAVKNAGTSNNKLKYTEAKVNKVDGEITLIAQEIDNLGTDVSQLLIDVNGISASVSNHTGAIAAIEIQADSVEARVGTVEGETSTLSLTVDGLELDIQDYVDGKLSGTKYTFDGSGATFINGGLTIKNNAGTSVLSADVNGNLTIMGTLDAVDGTFTGALSAATGSFSGSVSTGALTATGGTVGGWNITANSIYKGNTKLDATNDRLYLNSDAYLYAYGGTNYIGLSGGLIATNSIQGSQLSAASGSYSTTIGASGITSYNNAAQHPLTLNGNPILTTASAASASVRGGIKLEYDSSTNTLNIYN